MWLSVGILIAALITLSHGAESKQHSSVGLVNKGNNCYISAILQALYHLPSVREAVVRQKSNSIVHTTLASLFARMTMGTSAQEMDADFLEAVDRTSKGFIGLAHEDDPHAFFSYLLGQHLPWVNNDQMMFDVEETMVYQDVTLTTRIARENILINHVLRDPAMPVHYGLEETIDENFAFSLTVAECISLFGSDSCSSDPPISHSDSGSVSDPMTLPVTRIRRVISTPPILVMLGDKFKMNTPPNQQNQSRQTMAFASNSGRHWDASTQTLYDRAFEFLGKRYYLYSTVIYKPGDGLVKDHFFTHSCINAAENRWGLFDDGIVKPSVETYDLGNNPFMFFYVEESLVQQWTQMPPFTVDQIALRYRFLGQLFQSLVDSVHLMMRLTDAPFPKPRAPIEFTPLKDEIVGALIEDE
ncbi:hypothetical protein PSACC_02893 [Paramicrosporidium saccamoebae]|uniref:USP domain-containing protein n=1 Tax=Paramicrosporidium saccamoebae TaxID=1246581 RepID=A0A2H9THP2_9FUNG|nr:hypothetical protein PSACC_02893 [Paramicrosporidium saccamoebae]